MANGNAGASFASRHSIREAQTGLANGNAGASFAKRKLAWPTAIPPSPPFKPAEKPGRSPPIPRLPAKPPTRGWDENPSVVLRDTPSRRPARPGVRNGRVPPIGAPCFSRVAAQTMGELEGSWHKNNPGRGGGSYGEEGKRETSPLLRSPIHTPRRRAFPGPGAGTGEHFIRTTA